MPFDASSETLVSAADNEIPKFLRVRERGQARVAFQSGFGAHFR